MDIEPPSTKRVKLASERDRIIIKAKIRQNNDIDRDVERRILKLPEFLSRIMQVYAKSFSNYSAGRKKGSKPKIPSCVVGDEVMNVVLEEFGEPNGLETISDKGKRKIMEMIRTFLDEQETGTSNPKGL